MREKFQKSKVAFKKAAFEMMKAKLEYRKVE